MLSSIRASLLLITLALVGCQAQSTYTMWMEDSNHQGPIGYFPTHFIGLKLDSNGYAYITAKSGDYATYAAVLSFASQYQTPDVFGGDYEFPFSFASTGTYWVYATEYGTNYNYDWLEIRIVANSFSGTITPVYGTAPWFWTSGWPPVADPMLLGEHPEVPASQPAATNYTKWLVPLLVVVIVTALLVPVAMYIRRRRQQNKDMQATTAAQVENTAQDTSTTVQMTSV